MIIMQSLITKEVSSFAIRKRFAMIILKNVDVFIFLNYLNIYIFFIDILLITSSFLKETLNINIIRKR